MTERNRPGGEYYHRRERRGELPPYHQSARFAGEQPAGAAYEQLQEAIFSGPPNDLSAFRLIVNQDWHVAVLGLTPPDQLRRTLDQVLASGEPVDLPPEILQALAERRRQQIRHGSWIERHYR
jgi:hypothetical protein